MNFIEFIRGAGNVLLVMLIAGGVAYVGDRVGHQVGRKRLTLFNIRPRYTSTIIAIGTGMTIALVVTLVAILASQQVKTAFFKLSSLNAQIADLQARQAELETKVQNGHLVVAIDTLMVPFARIIKKNATNGERVATIQDYYQNAVKYVNATYPGLGLKPYVSPSDVNGQLATLAGNIEKGEEIEHIDVMLSVTSDQNLFEGDPIHFVIQTTPDVKTFGKGDRIYTIPVQSGAQAAIAIGELQRTVSAIARQRGLPPFLADSVQTFELLPNLATMQEMLGKPGEYLMTAYAAADVYPHLGGIPIVVALVPQPH
jgi:Protein of unknown function (DUF3084)